VGSIAKPKSYVKVHFQHPANLTEMTQPAYVFLYTAPHSTILPACNITFGVPVHLGGGSNSVCVGSIATYTCIYSYRLGSRLMAAFPFTLQRARVTVTARVTVKS